MSLKRKRVLDRLRVLRAQVEADGLPAQANVYHVAALTAAAIEILRSDAPERASAAARYVFRIATPSFRASGIEAQLACRSGCAWCCHGYVSASAPQIFAAAAEIRRNALDFTTACERLRASALRVRGLEWRSRIALRLPCPLLCEGACSIYPLRPLACRGFASFSAVACKRAFDDLAEQVAVPPPYASVRSALEIALRAALKACALPAVSYELTNALATALDTREAEARWLQGETVFDPQIVDRSADRASEFQREVMVDTLVALARGDAPAALGGRAPA